MLAADEIIRWIKAIYLMVLSPMIHPEIIANRIHDTMYGCGWQQHTGNENETVFPLPLVYVMHGNDVLVVWRAHIEIRNIDAAYNRSIRDRNTRFNVVEHYFPYIGRKNVQKCEKMTKNV